MTVQTLERFSHFKARGSTVIWSRWEAVIRNEVIRYVKAMLEPQRQDR